MCGRPRGDPQVKAANGTRAIAGDDHLQAVATADGGARVACAYEVQLGDIHPRRPQLLSVAAGEIRRAGADVDLESVRVCGSQIASEVQIQRASGVVFPEVWARILNTSPVQSTA